LALRKGKRRRRPAAKNSKKPEDLAMPDPDNTLLHRLRHWAERNEEPAFAIAMAGVAALFIIGIVSAFNLAATDVAEGPTTPPATMASRQPAETTGAGGAERPRPPAHDPREDEQMERRR
jgi:hypothetical protein